jgi:hypothetical protein
MKNILLIAHGKVAKVFINRVMNSDLNNKKYHVVYYDDKSLPQEKSEQFIFYKFDPTSQLKLSSLLQSYDYYQTMIVLSSKSDTLATYDIIREVHSNMQIVLLDMWDLEFNDANITIVNAHDVISNILSNYLPDIPLAAQNLGLGTGEIMEFKIPFGSPFTYRHISNIEQKRWRIAAIFREHKLIIPTPKSMLKPNDSILTVGNPNVLKSVYKSINREFGQFPIPFGENIYCYIDMLKMSEEEIEKLTNDAMLLHSNLNSNRLIFRVVNPTYSKILNKLKSYDTQSMLVELDFYEHEIKTLFVNDMEHFLVGLIITNSTFFNEHISLLHAMKVPVLKIGKGSFFKIEESVVISNESEKIEKISSIIFDISSQFKLDISLFEFEGEDHLQSEKVIEHFENLSKLFQEKVKVIKTKRNPIRELNSRDNFLQFLPFDEHIQEKSFFSFFSKNVNKLHFHLSDNYQLFLPSQD